jgi:hypothetical protein
MSSLSSGWLEDTPTGPARHPGKYVIIRKAYGSKIRTFADVLGPGPAVRSWLCDQIVTRRSASWLRRFASCSSNLSRKTSRSSRTPTSQLSPSRSRWHFWSWIGLRHNPEPGLRRFRRLRVTSSIDAYPNVCSSDTAPQTSYRSSTGGSPTCFTSSAAIEMPAVTHRFSIASTACYLTSSRLSYSGSLQVIGVASVDA